VTHLGDDECDCEACTGNCDCCGTAMEDRGDGPECPGCAERAYDRYMERMSDHTPPTPFTMADKDDPDGYRP
jgi:hypothetical protein